MQWLEANKRGGILGILAYLRCGQPTPPSNPLVEPVLLMTSGRGGGIYIIGY